MMCSISPDIGTLKDDDQQSSNQDTEIRQRTMTKRKNYPEDSDDDDNDENDNQGKSNHKNARKELKEDWYDSSDSECDIDELNQGFVDYSSDYDDYSDADSPEGEGEQEQEQEEQEDLDDMIAEEPNRNHPGRIKLRHRLVNSLEASLNGENYDR